MLINYALSGLCENCCFLERSPERAAYANEGRSPSEKLQAKQNKNLPY